MFFLKVFAKYGAHCFKKGKSFFTKCVQVKAGVSGSGCACMCMLECAHAYMCACVCEYLHIYGCEIFMNMYECI